MKFTNITKDKPLYLRSINLPLLKDGWTISVYINGVEDKTNLLFDSQYAYEFQ